MTFKSFLSAVGHDAVAVIKYLNSPSGQKTVQVAEAAAVTVGTAVGGPGLGAGIAGIELLINKGLGAALNVEANSALIGAQSGTGLQKAVAVAASVTATAEDLLKQLGYENPTVDQVELIANAVAKGLADIVNTIPPPAALVAPVVSGNLSTVAQNAGAQTTTGMVTR